MAIYSVDFANQANFRANIEAALTAAGVLTTLHASTGGVIIVTTTLNNKVLKFNLSTANYFPQLSYGDAFSAGTTITNEVSLHSSTFIGQTSGHLIIKGNLMVFIMFRAARSFYFYFGKTVGETEKYFIYPCSSHSSPAGLGNPINTSDGNALSFHGLRLDSALLTSGGNYYKSKMRTALAGTLHSEEVYNLEAVYRAIDAANAYNLVGDDVLINIGWTAGNVSNPHQALIADGNT